MLVDVELRESGNEVRIVLVLSDPDVMALQQSPPPPRAKAKALIWFALQCSTSKQCIVSCGYDPMPVSLGHV